MSAQPTQRLPPEGRGREADNEARTRELVGLDRAALVRIEALHPNIRLLGRHLLAEITEQVTELSGVDTTVAVCIVAFEKGLEQILEARLALIVEQAVETLSAQEGLPRVRLSFHCARRDNRAESTRAEPNK